VRTLSMHSRQGSGKRPLLGGYEGLKRELRSFFDTAPIASRAIRDKWKTDIEKARQRSKGAGSSMIFHSETGNWTARPTMSRTESKDEDGDMDTKGITRKSLQI